MQNHHRRRRRRRPTLTPRFGPTSIALEIGLLRMTIDPERAQAERDKALKKAG